MTGVLAVLAGALALGLLVHPHIAPGVKVLVLTAPPVAGVAWLLDEVFGRLAGAVTVVAVSAVVLLALNGLVGHPRLPTWARATAFVTIPVAAAAWLGVSPAGVLPLRGRRDAQPRGGRPVRVLGLLRQ
ncbi:hypothetical protein ACFZAV_25560 [Streptomyces sp. NPDC008343]|uniref:hypothetical protein n=1 Tax=Streptomyces sp. NPDC008343 TaxID=3364828 RepID=UPI0036E0BB68